MKLSFLIIELSLFCSILNSHKEYNLTSGILKNLGTININDKVNLYINSKFGQSVDIIFNFDSQDISNKNIFINIQEYQDSSKLNDNKYSLPKTYSDLTLKYSSSIEYIISSELCNYLSIEIIPNEPIINVEVKVTIKEKPQTMKSHNQAQNNLHEPRNFDNFDYEDDEDDGVFDDICEDGDDECGTFVVIVIGIILGIAAFIYLMIWCCNHCGGSGGINFSSHTAIIPLYPTD